MTLLIKGTLMTSIGEVVEKIKTNAEITLRRESIIWDKQLEKKFKSQGDSQEDSMEDRIRDGSPKNEIGPVDSSLRNLHFVSEVSPKLEKEQDIMLTNDITGGRVQ